MPKILFIAAHRLNRSPSQRFRFEQYFSYLNANGFECFLSPLLSEKDDRTFYSEGNFINKFIVVFKSLIKRIRDVQKANDYDLIFIQREAFMTGTTFFEKKLKKTGKKVIFDFDDAIWLPNISEVNKKFEWAKTPFKTSILISLSDLVIAGNQYLADYAKKYSQNVVVIPTTIDTEYHKRTKPESEKDTITIGWTGSHTTIQYFELALPFLQEIKRKYGSKISIKVIGDDTFENKELGIKGMAWNKEREITELSSFDIGIMPLPDDEWVKGKCGLKALQYMALEIPCVISSAGVNGEIISEGINGYLAKTTEEWIEKISLLIEDHKLRRLIGTQARKTVQERYSVNSQKERYLELIRNALKK